MQIRHALLAALMIAAIADATTRLAARPQRTEPVVWFSAKVVDPVKGTADDQNVLIRDGRIERVWTPGRGQAAPPKEATIRELRGAYVMPGLVAAHVHVSDVNGIQPRAYTDANTQRQLGVFARYGITTVLSLGGEQQPAFAARAAQNVPSLTRSRLYVSGPVITGSTAEAARKMVADVAANKPDVIKIRVDDNLGTGTKMTPEVYGAVIEEAHKRGLRVAAHIYYLDDAKALLKAGVDMIAHSVRDKEIDAEFIDLMKARTIPYCPTLTRELATFVYESTPGFFKDPFFLREADAAVVAQLQEPARQQAMATSKSAQVYKASLRTAMRNLKKASDAGVLVVMGTDSGAFPERFQGYFEHLEMEMMVDAGLTPAQVLRSATADAARAIGVSSVGTLAPGTWADFVVLERNPLEDIRHTRSIVSVRIAGNAVATR
jgi:imidazolonepropionase-like amidohydrolase